MQPSFRHDDIPIIARSIIRFQGDANGFVGHDTIVAACLRLSGGGGNCRECEEDGRHGTTTALRPPTWSLGSLVHYGGSCLGPSSIASNNMGRGPTVRRPQFDCPSLPIPELQRFKAIRLVLPLQTRTRSRGLARSEAGCDASPRWAACLRGVRFLGPRGLSRPFRRRLRGSPPSAARGCCEPGHNPPLEFPRSSLSELSPGDPSNRAVDVGRGVSNTVFWI